MKNSGKKIITFFAALFIVVLSFAANTLTVEQRAQKQMEKMNAVCALNAQQQAQVKQLYVDVINKQTSEKADREQLKKADKVKLNAAPVKREANPARKEFRESVKTILTAEQLAKWNAANQKKK
ncbi:MAG TPA: hypothetical protein VJY41_04550 [Prolixibacteraceae bacterium]|nr:hypothetical protein [Prolixibacteraceae bacterium]